MIYKYYVIYMYILKNFYKGLAIGATDKFSGSAALEGAWTLKINHTKNKR